jgi:glutamate---cysteine ligase / carboxylate-amine ligase
VESRFGQGPPPLTLGVEEELAVLDAQTLEQVGRGPELVGVLQDRDLPGRAKTELHASVIELNTDPCATAGEVLASLRVLRSEAAEAAAALGLAIVATGTHPSSVAVDQPIVPEERYLTMVAHHELSARRQNVQGLHVHLAMPSGEECWRVLEGMLPLLPAVLAVSANSPWFEGRLTGMASNRAPVLAELPRTAAPPAFGSYAGWEDWVERMVRLGVIADYTRVWWDIRPHPLLGTLEVRMPDQPTSVERSAALAGLLQELARELLDGGGTSADRADYEYNRWAAARFGPGAELIAPEGTRTVRAFELFGPEWEHAEAELQERWDDPHDATTDLVSRSLA